MRNTERDRDRESGTHRSQLFCRVRAVTVKDLGWQGAAAGFGVALGFFQMSSASDSLRHE